MASYSLEILQQALDIVMGRNSATSLLVEKTLESIKKSQEKVEAEADIEDLEKEVSRQEVINKISSAQAKALQELAIARRIDTALEVEIEEFYDRNGEGGLGVSASPENFKAGVHGSGNKVSRRIYRFKGFRDDLSDVYEELLKEQNGETEGKEGEES